MCPFFTGAKRPRSTRRLRFPGSQADQARSQRSPQPRGMRNSSVSLIEPREPGGSRQSALKSAAPGDAQVNRLFRRAPGARRTKHFRKRIPQPRGMHNSSGSSIEPREPCGPSTFATESAAPGDAQFKRFCIRAPGVRRGTHFRNEVRSPGGQRVPMVNFGLVSISIAAA